VFVVAQYKRTAAAVYEAEDSVETLVELMQIYREKGADIFTNICMLLGIMGFDDHRRHVSFVLSELMTLIVSCWVNFPKLPKLPRIWFLGCSMLFKFFNNFLVRLSKYFRWASLRCI